MDLQGQKTDSEGKGVERKGTFHLGKVDSFLCCQFLCQRTDHDPSSLAGWPRRGGCWSRSSSRLGRRRSSCRSCHHLNKESKPSVEHQHSKRSGPSNYQSRDNHSSAQRLTEIKSETGWEGQLSCTPNKQLMLPIFKDEESELAQATSWEKDQINETCWRSWRAN